MAGDYYTSGCGYKSTGENQCLDCGEIWVVELYTEGETGQIVYVKDEKKATTCPECGSRKYEEL